MPLIDVVKDVCAVIGVQQPASVFSGIASSRTQQELLALANEMAKRIARDTRDWTALSKVATLTGNSSTVAFSLPADFQRMHKTSQVWRSTSNLQPMRFVQTLEEFVLRQGAGYSTVYGDWAMAQGKMLLWPIMPGPTIPWQQNTDYYAGAKLSDTPSNSVWQVLIPHTSAASGTFADDRAAKPGYWQVSSAVPPPPITAWHTYLDKNCVTLAAGGVGEAFVADGDTFRLDERLLKLGMIWQWKADKGSPYAEDMANYEDALARGSGADQPAPILIGRAPISASINAGVAYPWPLPTP